MSRYPTRWLRRMRRLQENGYIKPPLLYDFIKSLPQLSDAKRTKKTATSYPEDVYVNAFYEKYSEVKFEAIDLNSFDPPLARRFAWYQMQLIKDGHPPDEAARLTGEQFKDELQETKEKLQGVKSSMKIAQEEEERVLHRALRQFREQKRRQLQSSVRD